MDDIRGHHYRRDDPDLACTRRDARASLRALAEALKVADVGDRIHEAAETIYQALIEAELTEAVGAAP